MTTSAAWRIKANQRERRSFIVENEDDDQVTITGWTVDAKIRTRPGGLVLYTFPDDATGIDSGGQVTLTIPAPISAGWLWSTGWYRVVVSDPDSLEDDPENSRVLEGVFVVDPD